MILSLCGHPSHQHLQAEITLPSGRRSLYGCFTCSKTRPFKYLQQCWVDFWMPLPRGWKVQRTDLPNVQFWACSEKYPYNAPYVSIAWFPRQRTRDDDALHIDGSMIHLVSQCSVWLISWLTEKGSSRKVTCFVWHFPTDSRSKGKINHQSQKKQRCATRI